QRLEERRFAGRLVLRPQTRERALEQQQCPAAIEQLLRRQIVARLEQITAFGVLRVERNRRQRPTALEGPCPIAFVRQEVAHGGAQKRSETAARGIGVAEVVLLEDAREELLRQIGGGVRGVPLAADERVDGIPVCFAEAR